MRFALYIETEHDAGPRCGVDAVTDYLARHLNDLDFDVRQGTQEGWSRYVVIGASPKRWER